MKYYRQETILGGKALRIVYLALNEKGDSNSTMMVDYENYKANSTIDMGCQAHLDPNAVEISERKFNKALLKVQKNQREQFGIKSFWRMFISFPSITFH